MIDNYSYQVYCQVYNILGGKTCKFRPVIGERERYHSHLPEPQFAAKLARLRELRSHDDEWLEEHIDDPYIIDRTESEAWEQMDLADQLFTEEIETALEIAKAFREEQT
jgi:hypothetical protein